jgi:hypothetical protein
MLRLDPALLFTDNRFSPNFYRTAAVCSWLSAVTTLLLIFLPEWYAPGDSFDARMARVQDPAYVLRSWVYLLHPFLVVAAALGVALRLRRVAASWVLPGLLAFLLWGGTEAAQQALTVAAFDTWRVAYLAGDEAVRSTMVLRTALYDDLWDAMYVLLLIGFMFGNGLYAAATLRIPGLTRVLGVFYTLAALLTLTLLLPEFGGPALPGPLNSWLYPAVQPLARALIGLWLWRVVRPPLNGGA